ncbi:MAG TPA: hypothetical protein VGB15_00300 [Longimicrobium sp.]|jgi:hypothetical protein
MTRLLFIVASLILVAAHDVAAQRKQTTAPGTADEIAIYRLLIDSIFTGRHTQAIVVADSAMSLAIPADSVYHVATRHLYPPVPREAIADFLAKNASPAPQIAVRAKVPVHRISRRAFHRMIDGRPHDAAWAEFYRRFGNATEMLVLSRIGFDAARRHALVDIRSYSHSYTTPHSGFVAHLERGTDGEWKIVHWRLLWVR